ncbi:MAG: SDR family NAD(P)-dependent oxidoreductase [Dehalococcoidia bacterium]
MTGRLERRVAIITGGNSGIGEATARAFGRQGAAVAILARCEAEGECVAKAIRHEGGQAVFIRCDVTDRHAIETAVAQVLDQLGPPQILVNNAGGGVLVDGFATSVDGKLRPHDGTFEATVRLNLTSTYMMTQVCWEPMVNTGGGNIINISSGAAAVALPQMRYGESLTPTPGPAYFASKAGVEALTRWIATLGSRVGIRANCIRPGLVDTPIHPRAADGSLAMDFLEVHQLTPGRGAPVDLANSILFLASDESRFINGQVLNVDGGLALKI